MIQLLQKYQRNRKILPNRIAFPLPIFSSFCVKHVSNSSLIESSFVDDVINESAPIQTFKNCSFSFSTVNCESSFIVNKKDFSTSKPCASSSCDLRVNEGFRSSRLLHSTKCLHTSLCRCCFSIKRYAHSHTHWTFVRSLLLLTRREKNFFYIRILSSFFV
jgi:hypothetical protein